jgi:hypothetical protein
MSTETIEGLENYEDGRRFLQLLPVDGYRAVYQNQDGSLATQPVVCFAIVEEIEESGGTHILSCVVAMVLSPAGGLVPADEVDHFVGVIDPGQTPDVFLND